MQCIIAYSRLIPNYGFFFIHVKDYKKSGPNDLVTDTEGSGLNKVRIIEV